MRRLSLLPALLAAACLAAPAVGQNLITNGSFEQPVTAADEILSASDAIPSWTISGSVGLFSNSDPTAPYQAEDGSQYIQLGTGTISQTFADTPGKQGVVSLWFDGTMDAGGTVFVRNGAGDTSQLGDFGNVNGQWISARFTFLGTGSDTLILSGAATQEVASAGFADHVVVTQPVPEGGTLATFGAILFIGALTRLGRPIRKRTVCGART